MSNTISQIGNQVFLHQNTPYLASKFASYQGKISFSDMVTSDMFEENKKRSQENRETEETEEIEGYLYDNQAYTNTPKSKKRKVEEKLPDEVQTQQQQTEHKNIIDAKNHHIDVHI